MNARCCLVAALLSAGLLEANQAVRAPEADRGPVVTSLLEVRRVYVAPLTGDAAAAQFRELLISALQNTGMFVLTESEERADAVLKGAGSDTAFSEDFESARSRNASENGQYRSGTLTSNRGRGIGYGSGTSEQQSIHTNERKHEAYAAVRLCNRDGDVLWSTTQQSVGTRIRLPKVDVAQRVARQLLMDADRLRRAQTQELPPAPASARP